MANSSSIKIQGIKINTLSSSSSLTNQNCKGNKINKTGSKNRAAAAITMARTTTMGGLQLQWEEIKSTHFASGEGCTDRKKNNNGKNRADTKQQHSTMVGEGTRTNRVDLEQQQEQRAKQEGRRSTAAITEKKTMVGEGARRLVVDGKEQAKIEKRTNRKRGETMGRGSPVSVLAGAQGLAEVAGVR